MGRNKRSGEGLAGAHHESDHDEGQNIGPESIAGMKKNTDGGSRGPAQANCNGPLAPVLL